VVAEAAAVEEEAPEEEETIEEGLNDPFSTERSRT
jgi:hypothetical protein